MLLQLYAKKTKKVPCSVKHEKLAHFEPFLDQNSLTVRIIKVNFKIFCYYNLINFMQKN